MVAEDIGRYQRQKSRLLVIERRPVLMAEHEFSQLPSGAGFAPAGVNRVGEGWANDRVEQYPDYELHLPLRDPRVAYDPPLPIPPPAPPTEAELRAQLADALAAKRGRETELSRAEQAHERAEVHLAKCRGNLAAYADLDAAIAAAAIDALRCSAGIVPVGLSEEMELAIADRERARTELRAADGALTVFRQERADASQAMGDATRTAETLATRVLGHRADALAREHDDFLAQAELRRSALFAYERLTTATKVSISPTVRNVLGTSQDDFAKLHDASAWRAAHAALLADAQAEVDIALEVPARAAEAA
jgi:hypothetical protein